MRHPTRARYPFQVETVDQFVGTVPQPFAAAKTHWRNCEMHLVDEISFEKFAHRGDATTDAHVFAVGRLERLRECVLGRRIEK